MKSFASIWAREPVVVSGALASILAVLIVFGVHISDAQDHALLAAVVGIAPLLAMFVGRSQVTPTSRVIATVDTPIPAPKPPTIPPLVLLCLAVVLLAGCGGLTPRDAAVDTINASTQVAAQVERDLAKLDSDEQEACRNAQLHTDHQACVEAVRARYAPAWAAYRAILKSRASAAALVSTYDATLSTGTKPTFEQIAKVIADLAAAEQAAAAAVATVQGAQ